MPVTQETYQRVALEDPEGHWELHQGRLREKPSMSFQHNYVFTYLGSQLTNQLDRRVLSRFASTAVIFAGPTRPTTSRMSSSCRCRALGPDRDREDVLEVYDRPMLLVVEVKSPSTGAYDVDAKIPEYMRRGDLEIWRVEPFDRLITVWRRQPDGTYEETSQVGGTIRPVALPGVTIDFDALFA